MEITTTTVHDLHWDFPNSQDFSAQITNNKITRLCFQDVGELTNSHLDSINEKYLRNIHRALSNLFQHLDQVRGVGSLPKQEEEEETTTADRAQQLRYLQKDEKDMLEHRENIMNRIRRL
ncbi:hypothetical protein RYH73_17755 [Olivibacter sp. CPCC 100613]|uniref:hypothetical protein n=1 Tax=Olivibacter sp. CPCC 100613 TaxID=3079931 RepID=UPI002FFBBD4F